MMGGRVFGLISRGRQHYHPVQCGCLGKLDLEKLALKQIETGCRLLTSNVRNGKESGPSAIGKADGVSVHRLTLRPFSKSMVDWESHNLPKTCTLSFKW